MKRESMALLALVSFVTTVGLVGASLAVSMQGPPQGKGGGGGNGGGDGGGNGDESVCEVVLPAESNTFNMLDVDAGTPLFGPDFGRPLAVAPRSNGEVLIVTSSNDNEEIVIFSRNPTSLDVVDDGPVATIDITDPGHQANVAIVRRFALGDLNVDGEPDVVVGDPLAGDGAAHVFLSQNDGGTLAYPVDPAASIPVEPPPDVPVEFFGWALAVGDPNRSGAIDVVVGAPGQASGSDAGQVFIFEFDAIDSSFAELANDRLATGERGDAFGAGVAVDDVTGEGDPELLVGAPNKDDGKNKDAGVTFVYSWNEAFELSSTIGGKKGEGLSLRVTGEMILGSSPSNDILAVNALSARTRRGVIFEGPIPIDGTSPNEHELPIDANHDGGYGPSSAGDLNFDGPADIVIGAPDAFESNGAVYLYLSGNSAPAAQCLILRSPDDSATDFGWTVATIPGSRFFLVGEPGKHLDGDGVADGQVYVFDAGNADSWPPAP